MNRPPPSAGCAGMTEIHSNTFTNPSMPFSLPARYPMNAKHLPALLLGIASAVLFTASAHAADPPLASPDVAIILSSTVVKNAPKNSLKQAVPAFQKSWIPGPCTASNGYQNCDPLRMGISVFPRKTTPGNTCLADQTAQIVAIAEDGGKDVEKFFNNPAPYASQYCLNSTSHRLDAALNHLHALTFPQGASQPDEHLKDAWFERPHLNLVLIDDLPADNGQTRIKNTLQAACHLHAGVTNQVPSMPTWALLARDNFYEVIPFAQMLAAAGGTGVCCDTALHGDQCDPTLQAHQLDVCQHIQTRTEPQLYNDLRFATARYRCQGALSSFSTGLMAYGPDGTEEAGANGLACHLGAVNAGGQSVPACTKGGRTPTDVLGIFACIRQLPRGMHGDETTFTYCPNNDPDCEILTVGNGIEFIDPPNNTLFMITGPHCDALRNGDGSIHVETCPNAGKPCDNVAGQTGRCQFGEIACLPDGQEYCKQTHFPMPELCNGLDDNCDGKIDNLSVTYKNVPEEHKRLACYGYDRCTCPDGPQANHTPINGDDRAYYAAWDNQCQCYAGLSDDFQPEQRPPFDFAAPHDNSDMNNQAACSTTTSRGNVGGLGLFALATFLFVTHRLLWRRF